MSYKSEFIEKTIKDFAVCLQRTKVYGIDHYLVRASVDSLYKEVKEILDKHNDFTLGIIDGELAFGREVFIELSKKLHNFINYLLAKNIERITFSSAIKFKELYFFIEKLADPDVNDLNDVLKLEGIDNIAVGVIKDSKKTVSGFLLEKAYINEVWMKDVINNIISGIRLEGDDIKFLFFSLLDLDRDRRRKFLKLAFWRRQEDITINHSLNVAILAMYYSLHLGFSRKDILSIGLGGFFHDLGKIVISKKIICSRTFLSEDDFNRVQMHPVIGAKLLLDYTDTFGIIPVLVAYEHHRRFDGGGYPRMRFNLIPSVSSMIVSICDVYDALRSRRSYKREYSPDYIYFIMQKEKGRGFSPQLLDEFFRFIGVWPVGTIVKLSNEEVGVVVEENGDDIYHPKVELFSSRGKIVDLRQKNNKGEYILNIKHWLDPYEEGKKYVEILEGEAQR